MFHGYPHMYFQRGATSDKKFIMSRMAVIPESLKESISLKYMEFEPVKGGENRKLANTWLHEEALKYRGVTNQRQEVERKIDDRASKSTLVELKPKTDTNTKAERKGFLDALLDDVDSKRAKKKESA